ncbi:MAG: response regulator [Spirochaetaceae bacterium]|nr:response regulator [Spirochaetaceae bacterium]
MAKDSVGSFLLVDDEDAVLRALSKQIGFWGYRYEKARTGQVALAKISENDYDLIFLDYNLGDMSGLEVLEEFRRTNDLTQVIMITSLNQAEYLRSAIQKGAFDYIVKPWSITDLRDTIIRALDYRKFLTLKQKNHTHLEKEVKNKTVELSIALGQIQETYDETILALGSALETRDSETKEHGLRVAHYSKILAEKMGFGDESFLTNLQRGAYLHDIGKIGVPDQILRKKGSLTEDEWKIMKKHPLIGKSIVEGIPFLQKTVPVIYNHHEHYNGGGYPQGLKENGIPVEARIFSVADALDALTSNRCYRDKVSFNRAKEIIASDSGTQFCPEVVDVLNILTEYEIRKQEVVHG